MRWVVRDQNVSTTGIRGAFSAPQTQLAAFLGRKQGGKEKKDRNGDGRGKKSEGVSAGWVTLLRVAKGGWTPLTAAVLTSK